MRFDSVAVAANNCWSLPFVRSQGSLKHGGIVKQILALVTAGGGLGPFTDGAAGTTSAVLVIEVS